MDLSILEEIRRERIRQKDMWSGEFDRENTINDWLTYMVVYLARGAQWHPDCPDFDEAKEKFRENLVKVATLAVAAIECLDKDETAPRHYDEGFLEVSVELE